MIAELGEQPLVWLIGSSTPCISLFKPWLFGTAPTAPVFSAGDPMAEAYWLKREAFHRQAIGRSLPKEFYAERDILEATWISAAETVDETGFVGLSSLAIVEEEAFYYRWIGQLNSLPATGKRSFHRYWRRKNAKLGSWKKIT